MVRLGLIQPFIDTLNHLDGQVEQILADEGISQAMLASPDLFVAARTMYELVEKLSVASGNPYAGIRVGEALDIANWSPIADALHASRTLGDFFLRFTITTFF